MKVSDFRDITFDGTIVLAKRNEEGGRDVLVAKRGLGVSIPAGYDGRDVKFIYPTSYGGRNAVCIEVE